MFRISILNRGWSEQIYEEILRSRSLNQIFLILVEQLRRNSGVELGVFLKTNIATLRVVRIEKGKYGYIIQKEGSDDYTHFKVLTPDVLYLFSSGYKIQLEEIILIKNETETI